MSKSSPSRMSVARRRAEMVLNQTQKRQDTFRQEQKLAHDATSEKTARLRELRLAKEAADKEEAASEPAAKPAKTGRSKKTKA